MLSEHVPPTQGEFAFCRQSHWCFVKIITGIDLDNFLTDGSI